MPAPVKNLYGVLGVAPDATPEQLAAAYQTALQLYREVPDSSDKTARLAQLADAYALLSNPVRRQVYDASLAAGQSAQIENRLQPGNPPAASDREHTPPPDHGLLSRIDPQNARLWRKGLLLLIALVPVLIYFVWQADRTRDQLTVVNELGQRQAKHMQLAHDAEERSRLSRRRVEIATRLLELGDIAPDNNTVDEAMEYDRLKAEQQQIEARLKLLDQRLKAQWGQYGRPN